MSEFNFESQNYSFDVTPETSTSYDHAPPRIFGSWAKRAFDISFCLLAIFILFFLMILIAAAIKYHSRGPVFFYHERVCADGRLFRCIKFRTMVIDAQERLQSLLDSDPELAAEFSASRKLSSDPRIIPVVGHFLRKTSLDELPQFFNVLMGQMSIVGPRPVTRDEFQQHYGPSHPYLKVRPGITGLWQVSGRNDVTYSERVQMDANYVTNWKFSRDLLIIFHTVAIVCRDCNGR